MSDDRIYDPCFSNPLELNHIHKLVCEWWPFSKSAIVMILTKRLPVRSANLWDLRDPHPWELVLTNGERVGNPRGTTGPNSLVWASLDTSTPLWHVHLVQYHNNRIYSDKVMGVREAIF